jgi:hypothetical protein
VLQCDGGDQAIGRRANYLALSSSDTKYLHSIGETFFGQWAIEKGRSIEKKLDIVKTGVVTHALENFLVNRQTDAYLFWLKPVTSRFCAKESDPD